MADPHVSKCCSRKPIIKEDLITIDRYDTDEGYYIFKKAHVDPSNVQSVIFFVHGYGAINPGIFGAWLEHLLDQNNIIIYPRYQKNLISPSPTHFTDNARSALLHAMEELKALDFKDQPLVFCGHSFGGVIISNLVAEVGETPIPLPQTVMVAEAGTGPFTSVILENYRKVKESIPFVVIAGAQDWTVGSVFGQKLFQEIPAHEETFFIYQKPLRDHPTVSLGASHYEPYAMDDWCDNGIHNLTYKRAQQVGTINELDSHGYWHWLDLVVKRAVQPNQIKISGDTLSQPFKNLLGTDVDRVLEIFSKVN